jgi:Dolichyl-phosphate-mannose-protein mannosyltransferase
MNKKIVPYLPGILLFFMAVVIALFVYKDYGIAWDESMQRHTGEVSMDYVLHGDKGLFTYQDRHYGVGFELPLIFIEKVLHINDAGKAFEMRHLVTHLFFLVSAFCCYLLVLRLYKSQFIACLGFLIYAFAPRIYAHSFFNSKDIPYLAMFMITFAISQYAFEKNRRWLFVLLGMACGYTTSLRIMGVILDAFILMFLVIDIISAAVKHEKGKTAVLNLLLFSGSFLIVLYACWPYLWTDPIHNFIVSYQRMSHFDWPFSVLLGGERILGTALPWTYFPHWFLITNPILWLISGIAGVVWVTIIFMRRPLTYLTNTPERNYLLYLMSFGGPILAVMVLHAVIYDDWRHLYFVYAPFVLLALYFINRIWQTRFKLVIRAACIIQLGFIGYFMVHDHPFQQVYCNELVSHQKESLRKNYELDYWGCGYKQALEHLVATHPEGRIKVSSYDAGVYLARFNSQLLKEEDRNRLEITTPENADYFITNYRWHPEDYPYPKIAYSVSVLNSTIICIYKTH